MTKFCNNIIPLPDTNYCTWNEPLYTFVHVLWMSMLPRSRKKIRLYTEFCTSLCYYRQSTWTYFLLLLGETISCPCAHHLQNFLKLSCDLHIWCVVVASQFTIVVVLGDFQSRYGSAPSNRVNCSIVQEIVWLGFALSSVLVIQFCYRFVYDCCENSLGM